jgi:hypothetical protein
MTGRCPDGRCSHCERLGSECLRLDLVAPIIQQVRSGAATISVTKVVKA